MLRRNILGLLVCVATLGFAAFGFAGIPDLNTSTAVTAAPGLVSVFNLPDASGARIDGAKLATQAGTVDATITVTLLDGVGNPVFNYPFEDMWLETTLGGLIKCPGGTTANFSTNILGVTTFANALFAYGASDRDAGEQCVVYVNGSPLVGSNMNILFNSADMDGNGIVNLTDLVYFVPFVGVGATYDYSADYYFDDVVNLSDLVLFAGGIGAACP